MAQAASTPPRILAPLVRAMNAVEAAPFGPGAWVATFAALIGVRHLLELLSGRLPVYRPAAFLVHYPLAYLAPALTLALLLALLSGAPVRRVTRLMLAAAALLLVPPLVDLALPLVAALPFIPDALAGTLGRLAEEPKAIGYLYGHGLLETAVVFLDPRQALEGTTAGIRVEALLACIAGALYVHLKARRWWRTLLTLPVVLVTALLFFTLPTRVFELASLFRPELTLNAFYFGTGFLEGPGTVHDGLSIYSLTVLTLAVVLAWVARDGGRAGLRHHVAPLAWSAGLGAACLTAAGLLAGWLTRGGLEPATEVSSYDTITLAALPLAAALATAGLAGRGAPAASRWIAAAAGAALAIGAGYPALAGLLTLAGAAWLGAFISSERPRRWLLAAPGGLVAGLAATAFGYLALTGVSGLAWIPGGLLLGGAIAGAGLALAAATDASHARWAASLTAGGGILAVVVWPLIAGAPAATVSVILLFFGGAALAARLGLPPDTGGLLRGALAVLVLAAAALTALAPGVRNGWTEAVLSLPRYHLDRGDELEEARVYQEARSAYDMAALLAPDSPEPALRQGLLEVARAEDVARARALSPLRPFEETVTALDEEKTRRVEAAAGWFRKALEIDDEHPQAWYNLGTAEITLGRCGEALAAFESALAHRPEYLAAAYQRAEALQCLGRSEEAVEAWRTYLALAEADPGQAATRAAVESRLRFLSARP